MNRLVSPLALLLLVFAILALAYSVVIPPFEGLDEIEHFGVVRYVADTGHLPVQGDASLAVYHVRQEASQPPLYYLLAGPLLRASGISTEDTVAYLVPNPYVTCGTEAVRANKATLRHDPFAEAFPWRDALLALHGLRAFSILLQAFTVAGVYAIARRVFPDWPGVALLAAAITAFNPQFLIVASGVNNDNVATPVITWAVYLCVVVAQEGLTLRRSLALGLLIGLSALSKLTGLLLLPLLAFSWLVYLLFVLRASRSAIRDPKSEIGNLAIVAGVVLAVSGWWYLRNWQLYRDPTGLGPMLDIVGRRGPVPLGLLLSELGLVFRSYWGQFACAFFDSQWYYAAWAAVAACGLLGIVLLGLSLRLGGEREVLQWSLGEGSRAARFTFYVLLVWFALVFIGWLRWNLTTPAPGGRLLFAAVGATSTLLTFGLFSLLSPLSSRLTFHVSRFACRLSRSVSAEYIASFALAGIGLVALLAWVRPLFAPPPMAADAAHFAARIRPQHSLDARFGLDMALLGYDLRGDSLAPGRMLDVTLYWRALRPMSGDYVLALQLAALPPGDTRTLVNFNTWPGGGNLPTAAWPVGPIIVDRYRVPMPLDTGITQAWRVQVVVYDPRSGDRLPLVLDGQPAGEALGLEAVRVAGARSSDALGEGAPVQPPVVFDESIALTQAEVGGGRVRLVWQCLKPVPQDVTVFVHAYDANGNLAATGDGPPMGGNFPTSLWQKGDQVLDEHALNLPSGLAGKDVKIKVGLYRTQDLRRLPAMQGGSRLPDDAVVIGSP